ncbi:MAG TPA: hypothetical protein PKK12_09060, partial [Candidatus Aminicenantes bacterium]|nr:hypothetical protein [Candidatus Aminicenantes bacterium]
MPDETNLNTGTIGELPEEGQGPAKKKLRKKKKNGPVLLAVFILAMLGIVLVYFASASGNGKDAEKSAGPVKSRELIAQEAKLQKTQNAQDKAMGSLRDKVLENPNVDDANRQGGDKYSEMLQYLKSDPQKLASENVIGQEEMTPEGASSFMPAAATEPGLRASVREQGTGGGSRAIYQTGSNLDPKLQKEDYEAEKQTFFAYSTSYRGATVYDGPQQTQRAQAGAARAPEAAKNEDEFAGKSEAEITKILEERYSKEAGLGGSSQQSTKLAPKPKTRTAMLAYNDMAPVKCFEGQFLDCVLLHKLISDTEESPVVVAVAKDF